MTFKFMINDVPLSIVNGKLDAGSFKDYNDTKVVELTFPQPMTVEVGEWATLSVEVTEIDGGDCDFFSGKKDLEESENSLDQDLHVEDIFTFSKSKED